MIIITDCDLNVVSNDKLLNQVCKVCEPCRQTGVHIPCDCTVVETPSSTV